MTERLKPIRVNGKNFRFSEIEALFLEKHPHGSISKDKHQYRVYFGKGEFYHYNEGSPLGIGLRLGLITEELLEAKGHFQYCPVCGQKEDAGIPWEKCQGCGYVFWESPSLFSR